MLQFMMEQGGVAPSELPTLQKLNELLQCGEAPSAAKAAEGPTSVPPPPPAQNAAASMLGFLTSPAVCAHENLDAACALPTLSLLSRLLAEPAIPCAPVPAPPPPVMVVPLPIVPGVADWGGTRTVTAPPVPPPIAAAEPTLPKTGAGEPEPHAATPPLAPQSTRPPASYTGTVIPLESGTRGPSPVRVLPSTPTPPSPPASRSAGSPERGPRPRASAARTGLRAGQLPRTVAAVLQQRQAAEAGVPTASPAPAPAGRSSFIERYMERLYARTIAAPPPPPPAAMPLAGGRRQAPPRPPPPTAPARPEGVRAVSPSPQEPMNHAALVARLRGPRAREPLHDLVNRLPQGCYADTVGPLLTQSTASGFGTGTARYAYDQQLQQYQRLSRLPSSSAGRSRPGSALLPLLTPAPSGGRAVPSVRGSSAPQRLPPPTPEGSRPSTDRGLDLTIVGSRISVPSPAPRHVTGRPSR